MGNKVTGHLSIVKGPGSAWPKCASSCKVTAAMKWGEAYRNRLPSDEARGFLCLRQPLLEDSCPTTLVRVQAADDRSMPARRRVPG
jgi:hypothetical protein